MSQQHSTVKRVQPTKKPHHPPPHKKRRRARKVSPAVLAVTMVFLVGGISAVLKFTGSSATARETAPVKITGSWLPRQAGVPDAAVGMKAPEVSGIDFNGHAVAIVNDGHAKAIAILAHWCPHCQRELPKVVDWLNRTGGIRGVDIYAVSTMASATRPNWPPSAWFEAEAWPAPVLVDDAESSVMQAFGLSGTPLWVFVRPDGTVANRISGEVPLSTLDSEMHALLG